MKTKGIITLIITIFSACSNNNYSTEGLSIQDYSFGLSVAHEIKNQLYAENYIKAENLIEKLSSDDLTQIVDYLSLNFSEDFLKKWLNKSFNPEYPSLILGVYYSHKAWVIRGYSFASEVSVDDALGFFDYQDKAKELLKNINSNQLLLAEKHSRLLSIYTGESNKEQEDKAYENCIKIDPKKIWLYIHRAESVQPKWGGSLKEIKQFLETLPDDITIKQIITLKLVWDSFLIGENLFGEESGEIKIIAAEKLKIIDREISRNPTKSIHRYILYNYMFVISDEIGNNILLNKYYELMDEKFTLYPYGIILE